MPGSEPSVEDGNEPGWIHVPTVAWRMGSAATSDAGDNGPSTMKWGYGGVPTPDPANLQKMTGGADKDRGSPTTLKWNYGAGGELFISVLSLVMC